jgi:hypothetical protein
VVVLDADINGGRMFDREFLDELRRIRKALEKIEKFCEKLKR